MTRIVNKFGIIMLFLMFFVIAIGCSNKNYPESVLKNYIKLVEEKKSDEAYTLLNPDNLPDKELFADSIENQPTIKSFKILKSKKVDDSTYKFLANMKTDNGIESENVFVLVNKGGDWLVSLNTDPTKNIDF
ncbi:hypothetical protein AAXB25_27755 [Paenibacillus lautus]|uniref:hypothetical protein n=1 Tax=Paenibacillus lautus TaxID=1401 RepID=UPI003D26E4A1